VSQTPLALKRFPFVAMAMQEQTLLAAGNNNVFSMPWVRQDDRHYGFETDFAWQLFRKHYNFTSKHFSHENMTSFCKFLILLPLHVFFVFVNFSRVTLTSQSFLFRFLKSRTNIAAFDGRDKESATQPKPTSFSK
jgi:hypothetical protein